MKRFLRHRTSGQHESQDKIIHLRQAAEKENLLKSSIKGTPSASLAQLLFRQCQESSQDGSPTRTKYPQKTPGDLTAKKTMRSHSVVQLHYSTSSPGSPRGGAVIVQKPRTRSYSVADPSPNAFLDLLTETPPNEQEEEDHFQRYALQLKIFLIVLLSAVMAAIYYALVFVYKPVHQKLT